MNGEGNACSPNLRANEGGEHHASPFPFHPYSGCCFEGKTLSEML